MAAAEILPVPEGFVPLAASLRLHSDPDRVVEAARVEFTDEARAPNPPGRRTSAASRSTSISAWAVMPPA